MPFPLPPPRPMPPPMPGPPPARPPMPDDADGHAIAGAIGLLRQAIALHGSPQALPLIQQALSILQTATPDAAPPPRPMIGPPGARPGLPPSLAALAKHGGL